MKRESGHMKVKVLDIGEMRRNNKEYSDRDVVEAELNEALTELAGYYIVDIKTLPNNLVAIMYLSKKKSESFKKHKHEEAV